MGLIDKISESIIHAMKNKDNDQLESLRAIKSALLLAKTQKNSNGEIGEIEEIKVMYGVISMQYKKQTGNTMQALFLKCLYKSNLTGFYSEMLWKKYSQLQTKMKR